MIGLGTIINTISIVAGGFIGHFTGKLFRREQQDSLNMACGISVLFIAIAGAMEGMLEIESSSLMSGKSMFVVLCLAIGTIIGELIGIENGFGPDYYCCYDIIHGKGMCVLCNSGISF